MQHLSHRSVVPFLQCDIDTVDVLLNFTLTKSETMGLSRFPLTDLLSYKTHFVSSNVECTVFQFILDAALVVTILVRSAHSSSNLEPCALCLVTDSSPSTPSRSHWRLMQFREEALIYENSRSDVWQSLSLTGIMSTDTLIYYKNECKDN